jgi:hypothetical protein
MWNFDAVIIQLMLTHHSKSIDWIITASKFHILYRVGQTQLGSFWSLITNPSNNTRENGKVPFVVDRWQPLEDGHKTETCSGYWIKYSNQCCVRRKPWTWSVLVVLGIVDPDTFADVTEPRSLRLLYRFLMETTSHTHFMSGCWERRRRGTPHRCSLRQSEVGTEKWYSHKCTSRWIPHSTKMKRASSQLWKKATLLDWRSYRIFCLPISVWSALPVRHCLPTHLATSLAGMRFEVVCFVSGTCNTRTVTVLPSIILFSCSFHVGFPFVPCFPGQSPFLYKCPELMSKVLLFLSILLYSH